jgi:TolB-like protein
MDPSSALAVYQFAGFTLDLIRGALLSEDGGEISLRPKSFALLRFFVEHPRRLLARDEIMRAIWPDVIVADDGIDQCVRDIRLALGDQEQRILRTVRRRGYNLDVPVEAITERGYLLETVRVPQTDSACASTTERNLPSLAILPFVNLSDAPEHEYFVDGITDELTNNLSRVHRFSVAAHGSAFAYKRRAMDIREAGRQLGVRYVLEGSVGIHAGQVRVTCFLSETETGNHIWTEKLQASCADLFELQDKIAEAITFAIEPNIQRAEIERIRSKSMENLDAYDLFLRARSEFYTIAPENCDRALALLHRAIYADPNFVLAKACAASCLARRVAHGWAKPGDRAEGVRLAREAASVDTNDPLTLICVADALGILARDATSAHAAASLALALHPNSIRIQNIVGWTNLWVGDGHAAISHFRDASRLGLHDPSGAYPLMGLAVAYYMIHRPADALTHAEAALRKLPDCVGAHQIMIAALIALGRKDAALAAVAKFRRVTPVFTHRVPAEFYRALYMDRAFAEGVIRALQEAGL